MLKYEKGEIYMDEKMKGNQNGRIRYDDAGRNKYDCRTEMPLKKVSAELGVNTDSLRNLLISIPLIKIPIKETSKATTIAFVLTVLFSGLSVFSRRSQSFIFL